MALSYVAVDELGAGSGVALVDVAVDELELAGTVVMDIVVVEYFKVLSVGF